MHSVDVTVEIKLERYVLGIHVDSAVHVVVVHAASVFSTVSLTWAHGNSRC